MEALRKQVAELSKKIGEFTLPRPSTPPPPPAPPPDFSSLQPAPISPAAISQERFPRKIIVDRIEDALARNDLTVKQIAKSFNLTVWSIYKKLGEKAPFSVEELDLIGQILSAPTGWPFIDWDLGLAIDHQLLGKPKP
jgi:hypothetical protein